MIGSLDLLARFSALAAGACGFSLVVYAEKWMRFARFRELTEVDGNDNALFRLLNGGWDLNEERTLTEKVSFHKAGPSARRRRVGRRWLAFDKAAAAAGLSGRMTPGIVMTAEFGLACVGVAIAAVLSGGLHWQAMIFGGLCGAAAPWIALKRLVLRRRREIQRQLPFALDILVLCVEAGLGLESALGRVTQRIRGELAREFRMVVHEVQTGKPRHEALRGLAERVPAADLRSLVAALVQAEQLGSSVVPVFRALAVQMRQRRAQRAEELAMKAPVKMLFPLIFCVFPALLIILFGPLVVSGFGGLTN